MRKNETIPVALTIAGSDSGGGAGIQADLKTFAALKVHGASVVTCVTAQNPKRVSGVEACRPEFVRDQLEAVFAELPPAAVKTGMLYSTEILEIVVRFFKSRARVPLIVDPVMVATSGARLLEAPAIALLELLPLASLVTPNVDEAEVLIGKKLRSVEDLRMAARELKRRFGCAALVKGGHLKGLRQAVDIFYDGRTELLLSAPFIKGMDTHGTGCTYSAAVTACMARGLDLPAAVGRAKEHITEAIAWSQRAAGHWVLNNFW